MPRTTRRATTTALPNATGPCRTEEEAAALMWIHYCAHKPQLVAGISDFRGAILEQLMSGMPANEVFAPFKKANAA